MCRQKFIKSINFDKNRSFSQTKLQKRTYIDHSAVGMQVVSLPALSSLMFCKMRQCVA